MKDRSSFSTEQRLPESTNLDTMSIEEALAVMHAQDRVAVQAVQRESASVAAAIGIVVEKLRTGGRLVYFGAGTSGRLGVLDAAECPPTFRTDPSMVQGVIAGGNDAMFRAKEGAEDSIEQARHDVDGLNIGARDVVMGIAAGGTTPYVHGALRAAVERGAATIFLTCVKPFDGEPKTDVTIRPLTGPEVLTGSTRLKAGTATKLVLNQITTISMVKLGKCYENLMVDLRATNDKLIDRALRLVCTLTGLDRDRAAELLGAADGNVKAAVLMHRRSIDFAIASRLISACGGNLRKALVVDES